MTATDAQHAALTALAEFGAALTEVSGLETVIDTALTSFDTVLGFEHVLLMIREPESDVLTTIASRGYDVVGIGSEVVIGQGVIGKVAREPPADAHRQPAADAGLLAHRSERGRRRRR